MNTDVCAHTRLCTHTSGTHTVNYSTWEDRSDEMMSASEEETGHLTEEGRGVLT